MIIVLDTNFLLIPGQFRVDIFEELERIVHDTHEICIFKETQDELAKIAGKNTKDRNPARIAQALIKQKNLKTLQNSLKTADSYLDDIIVDNCKEGWIVCTQDKGLKQRLKEKDIRVITLRSKKYLDFA